jgi:hypothetical protein
MYEDEDNGVRPNYQSSRVYLEDYPDPIEFDLGGPLSDGSNNKPIPKINCPSLHKKRKHARLVVMFHGLAQRGSNL